MRQIRRSHWLLGYQWAAGLCDLITGVLLIFAPRWTLSLMGVLRVPQPIESVEFIGVFVLSVGATYLFAAFVPMIPANAPRWQTVWWCTTLSRSLVAVFLMWKMSAGRMEWAWLTVACSDGGLAIFQWVGLGRDWLSFKD